LENNKLSVRRESSIQLVDFTEPPSEPTEAQLQMLLTRFPQEERDSWLAEALRLARLIERYGAVRPKRQVGTNGYSFVPEVHEICSEAVCTDAVILAREPRRAQTPSPHTMDGWLQSYRRDGLVCFVPKRHFPSSSRADRRLLHLDAQVGRWINANWRRFSKPRHLYRALIAEAAIQEWKIPSETWLYRQWTRMPEIVKAFKFGGTLSYEARLAPYVPRDYRTLEALQVLCGDHSERDVSVRLRDGTLCRPWLTVWCDLRTGLIWGWHLDLSPSALTAGLAYADGVMSFGAQPVSRPADGYTSYVYTDQGRDYRSHNWDGKIIAVHRQAMRLDGGLELLRVERKVGILNELTVRHLLARGGNPKEKPVERLFRDITEWEENNFQEFCGRHPNVRPEHWQRLYARHERLVTKKAIEESPFMPFETYCKALDDFIRGYNHSPHERSSLGSDCVIPLEEYRRLYTTRFDIGPEALALLLMKAGKRVIRKNGVQCFQKHWFFYHQAMAEFKGSNVEVRYTERDYSRVWVVLPDQRICEARLIAPTPLLNPDSQTLRVVAQARAYERKVIRDYSLILESQMRGESIEDRVAAVLPVESQQELPLFSGEDDLAAPALPPARVHQLTRMDRRKLRAVPDSHHVTAEDVAAVEPALVISEPASGNRVIEFDYET
jgi:transposase InsO family protein